MIMNSADTYFETQASALQFVYDTIDMENHYEIVFPDHLWCEHIMYGHNRIYHLELKVKRTGNPARKVLHISLYRMDSGNYELTYYLN